MMKRRISVVVLVAILAAVISPVFDLLPTALRSNHHQQHAPALIGRTLAGLLFRGDVDTPIAWRSNAREGRAACILSMDCVRLC